jgi:hypothetical protein
MQRPVNHRHLDKSLEVRAVRRRRLWDVQEGLEAVDNWTDMFEPLRVRRVGASRWRDVATLEQVASRVAQFLEERPDVG